MLTLRGSLISDVTAFVTRSIEPAEREAYAHWPERAADDRRLQSAFEQFGLPPRLD